MIPRSFTFTPTGLAALRAAQIVAPKTKQLAGHRPQLCCACLDLDNMALVATDGGRLLHSPIRWDIDVMSDTHVGGGYLIPADALAHIAKLKTNAVLVSFTTSAVLVTASGTFTTTSFATVSLPYPDWTRLRGGAPAAVSAFGIVPSQWADFEKLRKVLGARASVPVRFYGDGSACRAMFQVGDQEHTLYVMPTRIGPK